MSARRGVPFAPAGMPWAGIAIVLGALWGVFGYRVLWEGTPFAVNRRFVVSVPGTLLLLPVRLVLGAIHTVEDHVVHHPFDFSSNFWWIGVVSATVGAGIALALYGTVRVAIRLGRRRVSRSG